MTETLATATTHAARAHARAQAGTVTDAMPIVPASSWPAPPSGRAASMTWAETVPGGRYTSKVLARGTRLRLRDVHGTACANILLFRADAPHERLNVADTVKVPWQAYLGVGHPLLSDQAASSPRSSPTPPDATTRCAAPLMSRGTLRNTVRDRFIRALLRVANCSRSPPPSTTCSRATCRPRCPSSTVSASRRTAASSAPATPVPALSSTC
ncbi:hypothetical protein NJ76_14565 [Rhodococcus sp. IITR03]|nr:hypothetical protein NJ76_14565 [Rhodococcus sp. IITR03]